MELKDFTGKRLMYHRERVIPKEFWPNAMEAESQISTYNANPLFQKIILGNKYNPNLLFPLHLRVNAPNPFPEMITMQVRGIKPTFKKGGKIKVSTKKLDNSNKMLNFA